MSKAEAIYREYVALIPAVRKLEADRADDAALAKYDTKMVELRNCIEAAPANMDSVAALLLLQAVFKDAGAYADSLETATLRHIQADLTGLVREHVDLLLTSIGLDGQTKLSAMPFCG